MVLKTQKVYTSALESLSASLCLISLAIEKKTSSTFKFVFALWNIHHLQDIWSELTIHERNLRTVKHFTHSLEELDTILVCESLSFWCRNGLNESSIFNYQFTETWNSHRFLEEVDVHAHKLKRQKRRRNTYPFALIHISLVTHQDLVDIVRSMLFDVTNPIPNV